MTKYFFYLGNTYPHKNILFAINAIVELNKDINLTKNGSDPICFYISSSQNKFTRELQVQVNKLNAQSYIKLLGFVPDEKLEKMYENSVAFLYPSISEGFGLPGLEAMKANTILLASNIAVFKEIYQDHAIYFDPKNEDSLVNALEEALQLQDGEREKIIKSNKEFVKKYSWSKMARETLGVYNSFQ